MKGLYQPEQGMILHPNTVKIMLVWLVLCMTGAIGPIANAAHFVGLRRGCRLRRAAVLDDARRARTRESISMGSPCVIPELPAAAVIGGGFIGPVHVEALRRIGVEVVGLLGSSFDRAAQTARRLAIPRVYRDLDELLDDRQVGVVHVASPNGHHFEQARRVLESGRHVVCEKPLATSTRETAALRALAESRPAQAAAVNYNIRYYPLCHEIRERIASGGPGPRAQRHRFVRPGLAAVPRRLQLARRARRGNESPRRRRYRHPLDGSGPVFDRYADRRRVRRSGHVSPSPVQAARADRTRLAARARPPASPGLQEVEVTTDDHAAVLLRFDGGVRGAFHVSQVTAGRKNRLTIEIAATGGAVSWDSESPNRLWLGSRRAPNQILERDPALLGPSAAAISHYPGGHAEGFPDTFKQLFLDVYGWIVDGQEAGQPPSFPTFADGHQEVCLCEAIAASAAAERWAAVTMDPPDA